MLYNMLKKKQKSVSDQLSEFINPTPVNLDHEEELHAETAAKVVDNDYEEDWLDDSSLSRYRQQNAELIEDVDERYLGKKISRKSANKNTVLASDDSDSLEELSYDKDTLLQDSSEAEAEAESADDLQGDGDDRNTGDEDGQGSTDDDDDDGGNSGNENDDGESSGDEDDDENDDYDILQDESKDDAFQHLSSSKGDEMEKGRAIRNQLGLWDQLLETRIRLQKCLAYANRCPQPESLPLFKKIGGTDFVAQVNQTKQSATNLLHKLIALRMETLKAFSETKNLNSNKKRNQLQTLDDEEITSSEDEEETKEVEDGPKVKRMRLDDIAKMLEEQHNEFIEYRNSTIQKWNDKTRVAVGNVNSRNFSGFEQSTLRQIEQILANSPRLIARTQLKRSSYRVLGKPEEVAPDTEIERAQKTEVGEDMARSDTLDDKSRDQDTEIFDDDDFYHQLLRELIERKTTDVTDPVKLGRQWLELQKVRSKMKRKIDVRATKGRKLRFTVHPKLVNFMAPVRNNSMSEEAKTDLFNSLFGKTLDIISQQ